MHVWLWVKQFVNPVRRSRIRRDTVVYWSTKYAEQHVPQFDFLFKQPNEHNAINIFVDSIHQAFNLFISRIVWTIASFYWISFWLGNDNAIGVYKERIVIVCVWQSTKCSSHLNHNRNGKFSLECVTISNCWQNHLTSSPLNELCANSVA